MAHAMRGLEAFRLGRLKGKTYSDQDGRDLKLNFQRFSRGPKALHVPPAVVGHEEEDLEDTRIPRLGNVAALKMHGPVVKLDVNDLDPALVDAIKAGKIDNVSAEIYDEPPEGLFQDRNAILNELKARGRNLAADLQDARQWAAQEHQRQQTLLQQGRIDPEEVDDAEYLVDRGLRKKLGKMLRRLAFIGGDPACVKGLNQEGLGTRLAVFSERSRITRISRRGVRYAAFTEDRTMNRDEMIQQLAAKGMDEEVLNGMDDRQLAEILKSHQGGEEEEGTAEEQPEATAMPEGGEEEGAGEEGQTSPEEEEDPRNEFDDSMPEDKDSAMSAYSEHCRKYGEAFKRKFGEDILSGPEKPAAAIGQEKPATFSEGRLAKMVTSAVTQALRPLRGTVTKTAQDAKRQRIAVFCETQVREGRISPAEMDETDGPTLADRLMKLDDTATIHKFSDGGKERSLTQLDAELRAIRRRPSLYKGERVRNGKAGATSFSEGTKESRRSRFQTFTESRSATEAMGKVGTTQAELLKAFDAANEATKQQMEQEWEQIAD